MGLFGFKKRFVPFIQDGTKCQTIRSIRRHPQKVGQLMHLYVGLRQTGAKRIIDPVPCKDIKTIFILFAGTVLLYDGVLTHGEALDIKAKWTAGKNVKGLRDLTTTEKNKLAWHDGFRATGKPDYLKMADSFELMHGWIRQQHGFPFIGHIMYW